MCDNKYMEIAINEAKLGIEKRHGGPFGAIIVKDGKIIAQNHNRVIETNDPTAHAEMLVIREASKILNTFDLSECILYTSCEPCPMCYAAVHWAKIPIVYYGATKHDAKTIGFDDEYIYEVLLGKAKDNKLSLKNISRDSALKIFSLYEKDDKKCLY